MYASMGDCCSFIAELITGDSPLYRASRDGDAGEVTRLLNEGVGVDINKRGSEGYTPLCVAFARGHVEVVKLLLDVEADIHKAADSGCTPLYLASWMGNVEMVKLLAERGADMNTHAKNTGETPLSTALKRGDVEMVKLLAEFGVDIHKATIFDHPPQMQWSPR